MTSSRNKATLLAFSLGIVATGSIQDCVDLEYVRYGFALSTCPDEAFSLPDAAQSGTQSLSREESYRWAPACPGYKLYRFFHKPEQFPRGISKSPMYVRLERGPSCTLHVVGPLVRRFAVDPVFEAEAVAQLVIQGSNVPQPRFPAASREELGLRDAFKVWCTRQAEGAARHRDAGHGATNCT